MILETQQAMKKLKLFGINIWISRAPIRVIRRDKNRNNYRNSQRNLRLEMADNRCEVCGKPVDKSCHIHHTLPAGTPDRNKAENMRVLCGDCWRELQKKPHIHGYQHMEDNTVYDGDRRTDITNIYQDITTPEIKGMTLDIK